MTFTIHERARILVLAAIAAGLTVSPAFSVAGAGVSGQQILFNVPTGVIERVIVSGDKP